MFEGGFDTGKGILPLVVGWTLILMAFKGDNFMFTCDHSTLQWQTIICGLEEIPRVNS